MLLQLKNPYMPPKKSTTVNVLNTPEQVQYAKENGWAEAELGDFIVRKTSETLHREEPEAK